MSAIERILRANRAAAGAAAIQRSEGGSGASGVSVSADRRDRETSERPEIEISFDEQAVNNLVIQALAERSDLYDANGSLAVVTTDANDPSRKVIRRLPMPSVREFIAATVRFYSCDLDPKSGRTKRNFQRVPKWSYEAIVKRGHWPGIPAIRGIVTCPVLRVDGSILQESGFDANSGLFLDLHETFPPIPNRPSAADIQRAVKTLFDVVGDFPFANDASSSAWLASLLTPLAREAYAGATGPLFLIDANTRGSGKSLLADVNSLIVEGREATRLTAPRDDEEARKRITALVNDSVRLVLIDNIAGKFGSAALDAALTGSTWKDRRLGSTELVEAPLRMTWYGSGNNVILAADTARRTCHIRLESPLENPEDRAGFKYADIRQHCREHRPGILAAALTILRGFIAAGRPQQQVKPWGSFEGWSDLVRNAIVWCGLEDPGETRTELRATSDSEAEALRQMLTALQQIDQDGHGLRTTDILKISTGKDQSYGSDDIERIREAVEVFCDAPSIERANSRKLGNRLAHFKSRVVDGCCLNFRISQGSRLWFAVRSGGSVVSGDSVLPHSQREKSKNEYMSSCDGAETESPRGTESPAADLDWIEESSL